ISEKYNKLIRGSVVGIAAGVFAFLGLILLMVGIAFLIDDIFNTAAWVGFVIEAVVFFLIAAGAGYFAYRSVRAGAPPTPDMAIEEGKRIRQTLESGTTPAAKEPTSTTPT
ncbi:MAG: phage holin family protein, partial [Solirubrobacterales bacterium]